MIPKAVEFWGTSLASRPSLLLPHLLLHQPGVPLQEAEQQYKRWDTVDCQVLLADSVCMYFTTILDKVLKKTGLLVSKNPSLSTLYNYVVHYYAQEIIALTHSPMQCQAHWASGNHSLLTWFGEWNYCYFQENEAVQGSKLQFTSCQRDQKFSAGNYVFGSGGQNVLFGAQVFSFLSPVG